MVYKQWLKRRPHNDLFGPKAFSCKGANGSSFGAQIWKT